MLFLKREDLLPYGGGNKVRRFLLWLKELSEREGICTNGVGSKTIAVLSDQGAHTFHVLTRMLEAEVSPVASLLFWERTKPKTAYSDNIRRAYLDRPNICVQSGASVEMLLRFLRTKWVVPRDTVVMGIGGSVRTKGQPYRGAFKECLRQLAEFGRAGARVWHLFPVASGNMADSFLRTIRDEKLTDHRVIGVLTGPGLLSRLMVRLKYLLKQNIVLVRRPKLSWPEYLAVATRFFKRTGVWVDPSHCSYAASLLEDLPRFICGDDVIVFWITCPFIEDGPIHLTNAQFPMLDSYPMEKGSRRCVRC
jgi:hypothetical protein